MTREQCYKVRILTKESSETILVAAKSAPAARRYASLKHVEVVEATFDDINILGAQGTAIQKAID